MTTTAEAQQQQWESSTDPEWMLEWALQHGVSRRRIFDAIMEQMKAPGYPSEPIDDLLRWTRGEPMLYTKKWATPSLMVEFLGAHYQHVALRLRTVVQAVASVLGQKARSKELNANFANTIRSQIPWTDMIRVEEAEPSKPAGTPPRGAILRKTLHARVSKHGDEWSIEIYKTPESWSLVSRDCVWHRHLYPTQEIAEAYARAKLREMGELPAWSRDDTLVIHGKTCRLHLRVIGPRWSAETYLGTELVGSHWRDTELEALDAACAEIARLDKEHENAQAEAYSKPPETTTNTGNTVTINYSGSLTTLEQIQAGITKALERANERGSYPKPKEPEKMSGELEPVDTGSVDYARLCLRAQAIAIECTSMESRRVYCIEVLRLCASVGRLSLETSNAISRVFEQINNFEMPSASVGDSDRDEHVSWIINMHLQEILGDNAMIRSGGAEEIIAELTRLSVTSRQIHAMLDEVLTKTRDGHGQHTFTTSVHGEMIRSKELEEIVINGIENEPSRVRSLMLQAVERFKLEHGLQHAPKQETTMATPTKPETCATAEPSTTNKVLQTIKSDATDAAWRTAGVQFVRLVREPLVAALCRHLAPGDESMRGKIAAFLETEIGTALLASVLSVALSSMPQRMGEVPQKLARELRVAAMADTGIVLSDLLLDPMLRVVSLYLQDPAGAIGVETPALEEPSNVVGITEAQQKVGVPR